MASLQRAKDTIRALDAEIQMRAVEEVNKKLVANYGAQREAAINAAVAQILADTPALTLDDGSQLRTWQEAREQRRGGNQPDPQ